MPLTEEARLLDLGFSAVRARDEVQLLRTVDDLGDLGIKCVGQFPEAGPENVVSCIQTLGEVAVEKGLTVGLLDASVSLGRIGQEAARKGVEETVLAVASALVTLGKKASDSGMPVSLRLVATTLKEVGKEAARKGMEKAAITSQSLLKEIATFSGDEDLELFQADIPSLIRDVGKSAAGAGLENAVISAELLLEDAQIALNWALLRKRMSLSKERRICEETCTPLHCLGELGKLSSRKKLGLAAAQAALSIETVRKNAEAAYLGNTVLSAECLLDSFLDVKVPHAKLNRNAEEIRRLHEKIYSQLAEVR